MEYSNPLDRYYYENIPDRPDQMLTEPIIPVNKIGATIPEKHPGTGGNIIQNIQASIRSGASTGQLVMTTPHTAAMGGRAKAYGKEVRQAIREVVTANEFDLVGAEMPVSSMSNLSGFSGQRGAFSDTELHSVMTEVRDTMKFVADIAGGGGVDVLSQEAPRTVFDQDWAKRGGEQLFMASPDEDREGVTLLVDSRTGDPLQRIPEGTIHSVPKWKTGTNSKGQTIFLDEDNKEVAWEDRIIDTDDNGQVIMERKSMEDYRNMEGKIAGNEHRSAAELFLGDMLQAQINTTQGRAKYDERLQRSEEKALTAATKLKEQLQVAYDKKDLSLIEDDEVRRIIRKKDWSEVKDQLEEVDTEISSLRRSILGHKQSAAGALQQANEWKDKVRHMTTGDTFGKEKSKESYAELGIFAMQETKNNPNILPGKDLHVGPENGWPQAWGGHPDEFIELIEDSRKKMVNKLRNPTMTVTDSLGRKKVIANPHHDPTISEEEAKALAHKHIKGTFDTGHMGMWLDNFRTKPGETSEQRLKEFNKWYMEHIDKIIKADVVGTIQAVDSATGAHGHLPPGQGIFPVVDAVKKFKEAGYQGAVVSEGHEEDQFTPNRILTKAWEQFGSPIGGYSMGAAMPGRMPPGAAGYGRPWGGVQGGYFGRTYTPFFIVGAYSPSNDWKLWSEVPFE